LVVWGLVGLDVRLALFTLEAVVFVAQALVLCLQLAHGRLQVFDQVEQQANRAPRTGQVLDAIQVNLGQRLQRGGLGRTPGHWRNGCFSHSYSLSYSTQPVYDHRS